MKKLLYFILVVLTISISSCTTQSSNGQLVGASGRPIWYQADPYGMLYIQSGAFNMGQSDEDVPNTHNNKTKTVSVAAFYMDQTEITNNEYRQFVNYVKDSIARRILGAEFPDRFLIPTYDDELQEKGGKEKERRRSYNFNYTGMALTTTASPLSFCSQDFNSLEEREYDQENQDQQKKQKKGTRTRIRTQHPAFISEFSLLEAFLCR